MSWLGRITALMALLLVFPGAMEGLENAVHLIGQGHLAHAGEAADRHAPPTREHGCTGTFHFCSCCAPASAVLIAARDLTTVEAVSFAPPDAPGCAASHDLPTFERPPQS
jgi:hypothetical protein